MKMPWNRAREWKVKWKCLEIEIEKWNRKKILENSRETRLSQVTGGDPRFISSPYYILWLQSAHFHTVCQILNCWHIWQYNRQYFWHSDGAIHCLFGLLITFYDCKGHISLPLLRSLNGDIFGTLMWRCTVYLVSFVRSLTGDLFGILMLRCTVYVVSLLHIMTAKVIYHSSCGRTRNNLTLHCKNNFNW